MMCDIVERLNNEYEAKQEMKRHIRIHAGGENKIVIDESVGEVIYVQTRYIDMQKRVGWALAHLCPSQHAQHACHFFFAAAHGLHVRVHTHTHTNILTQTHTHTYLPLTTYASCLPILCIRDFV